MFKYLIKSWLLWLTLALLAIVPFLAYLQWKWVNESAQREEERLLGSLSVSSVQCLFSFTQRMMHLQHVFSAPPAIQRLKTFSSSSLFNIALLTTTAQEHWSEWKSDTEADFVNEFFYVLPPNDKSNNWRVFRFDTTAQTLVPSTINLGKQLNLDFDFMPPISRAVEGLSAIVIPMRQPSQFAPLREPASTPEEMDEMVAPATMMALGMPENAFIIVMLNPTYLREKVFPQLVQTHFGMNEHSSHQYQCGVVWRDTPDKLPKLLYSSDPTASVKDFEQSDMILPIGFIPPRGGERFAKILPTLLARVSSVSPAGLTGSSNKENLQELFAARGGGSSKNSALKSSDSSIEQHFFGQTELRVQYKREVIEQEVSRLRLWNLSVSFGALVLLSAGLVLIFATVARSERLLRQQMQFVAGISHEFRTPLAVLSSASENLADGLVTNSEQAKRYGQVMKQEITRLTVMVEQTLSFAGIQAGRHTIDPKPISVQSLVEFVLQRHHNLLLEEDFTVRTQISETLPNILADVAAMTTVLDNLIINAVKYSTDCRELRIEASSKNGTVDIIIQDKGRGIPPDELAHIFEPFFRGQRIVEEQIHGNGLGLAIVQHIVQQHGGTISMQSQLGSGTKCTITLKAIG